MHLRSAAPCALALFSAPVAAEIQADAETLLAEIEAARAEVPEFDRSRADDEAYVEEFLAKQRPALDRYSQEILDLYEAAPRHEALGELLPERWQIRAQYFQEPKQAVAEIEKVLAADPSQDLATAGRFWRAYFAVAHRTETGYAFPFETADRYVGEVLESEDDASAKAGLLAELANRAPEGSQRQVELFEKLIQEYGDTRMARGADAKLYQLEKIGEPFELSFTDAITGEDVSMEELRGKAVVVDFWATWCAPCVAEMPHMKDLYEDWADRGVEFIGVSLDAPPEEGGLEKLKAFVEEREIPWPQYYQGNGWQSEFSSSWRVQGIPAVFLVDAEGKLASVRARGRLEELLPEYAPK